jgi:trehalose synthase
VRNADAYAFSRAQFVWDGLDPGKIAVIHPSIDPFSAKNQDQTTAQILVILTRAGILADGGREHATFAHGDETPGRIDRAATLLEAKPLTPGDRFMVQVSRWDRLPHAMKGRVHVASLPTTDIGENAAIVNALQRHSAVVVQKSIAEGFGLTVAEAMWKERAVVASGIGGIRDRIVDGESGVLLSDPRDLAAFGSAVVALSDDRERARWMGVAAHARIRDKFLGPRHLRRHFELIERVMWAPISAAAL